MSKDTVTNTQLYSAIMEVHKKIDEIVEKRITPLEIWKAQFMGQLTAIVAIVNLAIAISFDWIKKQIFKNNV